jgi:hypothetical protein
VIYLGFATRRCGFRTPIQPSTSGLEATNQKWIETGGEFPFVACDRCKSLYRPKELETGPSNDGLSPYRPGAPLHVFHVSIPCDELDCPTQIQAIAVRNSDTSEETLHTHLSASWTNRLSQPANAASGAGCSAPKRRERSTHKDRD